MGTRDKRMEYGVMFVDDHELPGGHDWALARDGDGFVVFIKVSRACPRTLEEAWLAYRAVLRQELGRAHNTLRLLDEPPKLAAAV